MLHLLGVNNSSQGLWNMPCPSPPGISSFIGSLSRTARLLLPGQPLFDGSEVVSPPPAPLLLFYSVNSTCVSRLTPAGSGRKKRHSPLLWSGKGGAPGWRNEPLCSGGLALELWCSWEGGLPPGEAQAAGLKDAAVCLAVCQFSLLNADMSAVRTRSLQAPVSPVPSHPAALAC